MTSVRPTYRNLALLLIPILLLVSFQFANYIDGHTGTSEHNRMMTDNHHAMHTNGKMVKPCCAKHMAKSLQCNVSFDCECKVDNQNSDDAVTTTRNVVQAVQRSIQITVGKLLPVAIQKILEPLLKQINGPPIYLLTNAFLN